MMTIQNEKVGMVVHVLCTRLFDLVHLRHHGLFPLKLGKEFPICSVTRPHSKQSNSHPAHVSPASRNEEKVSDLFYCIDVGPVLYP